MGTVVGVWRLKAMIVLFIIIISIYGSTLVLGNVGTVNEEGYIDYSVEQIELNENDTASALEEGNDVIGAIFGVAGFITFDMIDNAYARFMLNMFMAIIWISVGYILYTYIKEWIPIV